MRLPHHPEADLITELSMYGSTAERSQQNSICEQLENLAERQFFGWALCYVYSEPFDAESVEDLPGSGFLQRPYKVPEELSC